MSHKKVAGFSLVEIMVALVIGMLATIVVLQLFSASEARNRTASGSADAQSNGVITFYQLESNIERAGFGMNAIGLFGCPTTWEVTTGTISKSVVLAPAAINPKAIDGTLLLPAGDANTDTLLVMFGNGNGEPSGNTVNRATGSTYYVQMPSFFSVGDRVIAVQGTDPTYVCGTTKIDRITAVNPDPATATVTVANSISAGVINATSASLLNLGPGPNGISAVPTTAIPNNGPTILAYAIRKGNLTVCDFSTYDCSDNAKSTSLVYWVPIANNIVSMRAVYWKDTSAAWDGSGNPSHDQTQPADACGWAKIKGISLVLVARSDERDKDVVTTTAKNGAIANAPSWSQVGVAPLVATSGSLGPDAVADEDWKHYRYKTLQSDIPIRNVTLIPRPTAPAAQINCTPFP
jgi:type IV pilus assembly protein PilW